jgi:dolichol-phosphate mannosyltransferase
MRVKDISEFMLNSFRLRLKLWERIIKFGLVGLSGVVVNTVILGVLTELAQLNYKWSSLIAIQIAIISNFIFNDKWTFVDRKKQSLTKRFLSFESISIIGAVINWALLIACTELLGIHYLISNLIGILIAFIWNYIANNKLTWNNKFAKKK